jgi:ATP-dependent Clp protease protease subunit
MNLYINSPGGSVSAGLAIFDTMNFVKADVQTIVLGKDMASRNFNFSSLTLRTT